MRHIEVYRDEGVYAGWPANHGMWSWGEELLVGFSVGKMERSGDVRRNMHAIDWHKAQQHVFARSIDGGESWSAEDPAGQGSWIGPVMRNGTAPEEPGWQDLPEPIDFEAEIVTLRMVNLRAQPSRFYVSADRGKTWRGPFTFPCREWNLCGVHARTDVVVESSSSAWVGMTAAQPTGREGRAFMAKTNDGGITWKKMGWMTEDPGSGFSIMPSTVLLDDGKLLSAVRLRSKMGTGFDKAAHAIKVVASDDGGRTWSGEGLPTIPTGDKSGNPGCMTKLQDGRVVLTYATRGRWRTMGNHDSSGIKAMVFERDPRIWNQPIWLRQSTQVCQDIGYVRTKIRSDGKLVTCYYWHDERTRLSERYIAGTIWDVNKSFIVASGGEKHA